MPAVESLKPNPILSEIFRAPPLTISVPAAIDQGGFLVDVRTPAEFAEGALVGAFNLPLFQNAERSQIGILYKHAGKEAAIELGYGLVHPRLDQFAQMFEPFRGQPLTVYCARGGMRSGAVVRWLQSLGFQAQQMEGGYKRYRNLVLTETELLSPAHWLVLHGQTGVGKTLLLQKLSPMVDLEGLAQHRSSLFGAVNKQPRTQKNFEAHLHLRLRELNRTPGAFIEGESHKVGHVKIPASIFQSMKRGICLLLEASLETRVKRIIQEYWLDDPATLRQLETALHSLRMALGHQKITELVNLLHNGKFEELVAILLNEYYDPRYRHAMRHYQYSQVLSAEDLDEAAQQLLKFRQDWLEQSATENIMNVQNTF